MRDWAIDYILHILETKQWSMNRLAQEAGVATSTIARPIREREYPHKLSRDTITKIREASGIDPAPFIPAELAEDANLFSPPPGQRTRAGRILAALDTPAAAEGPNAQATNEIKIAIVGPLVQIVATVNKAGLARLRAKLDMIESILDEE
jgi:lambda repressor-like predicted transcriptional regulator